MVCTKHKVSATTGQHKYLLLRISFVSTDHLRKPEIKYLSKEQDIRIEKMGTMVCVKETTTFPELSFLFVRLEPSGAMFFFLPPLVP